MRAAALAGGTGLVGGCLLRELLEEREYGRIVALVRRPMLGWDARVEQRIADFENLDAMNGAAVEDLYCALGTTIAKAGSKAAFRKVDHDYALSFARWGKARGARRFLLVSSVGAGARSSNFYLRVKGELENDVAALGFESLSIFQPSILVGVRMEERRGEALGIRVAVALQSVLVGPLAKYRPMPAERLARAMVKQALHAPPGVARLTFREIVARSA